MPERSSQQDEHIHPFALRVPFAKSLILFRSGRYGMDGAQGKSAGVPIPDSQPCRRYPFKREHMRLRLGVWTINIQKLRPPIISAINEISRLFWVFPYISAKGRGHLN